MDPLPVSPQIWQVSSRWRRSLEPAHQKSAGQPGQKFSKKRGLEGYESFRKTLALLVAGGAAAYLLSCVAQDGPTLHGPAGFAVPVGVPLILGVAGYILKMEEDDELEYEEEEEGYGEEEGGEE